MWYDNKIMILSCTLLLSLAFNVGMLAWLGGSRTGAFAPHNPNPAVVAFAAFRDMPSATRDQARDIIKKYQPELRQHMDDVRQQKEIIRGIVTKDPLDRDALKSALDTIHEKIGSAQAYNQQMVMELMPLVPPEKRLALLHPLRGRGCQEEHAPETKPGEHNPDMP